VASAGLAWRFIDLLDGLRPRAAAFVPPEQVLVPAFSPLKLQQLLRLVAPVLAPVLGDRGFAHAAVLLLDAHLKQIYQADEGTRLPLAISLHAVE
jgi:hypothetical protein